MAEPAVDCRTSRRIRPRKCCSATPRARGSSLACFLLSTSRAGVGGLLLRIPSSTIKSVRSPPGTAATFILPATISATSQIRHMMSNTNTSPETEDRRTAAWGIAKAALPRIESTVAANSPWMNSEASDRVSNKLPGSGASVAIIGAGAAGLAAGRLLRDEGLRVTIFEKETSVGGVWRYSADGSAYAPMCECNKVLYILGIFSMQRGRLLVHNTALSKIMSKGVCLRVLLLKLSHRVYRSPSCIERPLSWMPFSPLGLRPRCITESQRLPNLRGSSSILCCR